MNPPERHLDKVDVLRAAAILSVFVYHILGFAFGAYTLPWAGLWPDVAHPPAPSFYAFYPLSLLWTGVPLFFVISGFCIHHSYLQAESKFSLSGFFWRRFWRIYPAYFLCLLVLVAVQSRSSGISLAQLLSHLFLVHNLHPSTIFGINIPFWSLAAEAQLYLLYPIFLFLRQRFGVGGALQRVFLITLLARIPAALLTNWDQDLVTALWESPLILWIDWCLGAAIAEWARNGRLVYCGNRRLLLATGLVFWLSTLCKVTNTFSFTLASVFWGVLMAQWLVMSAPLKKWMRWLLPAGWCSYSMYLWHFPIQRQILSLLGKLGLSHPAIIMSLGLLVTFAVTFGISWVLYRWVEMPGIRFGKRFRAASSIGSGAVLLEKQQG